jgi:hypothetical protein
MAAAVLNGLGIIAAGITLVPLLSEAVPETQASITTVRIHAGIGEGTDGNAPTVAAFDVDGKIIGATWGYGNVINKGAHHDLLIDQKNKGAASQAQYIAVMQDGTDALCIAGITATLPDGQKYAW